MKTVTAQEIKRCGIGLVDRVGHGRPVHVLRNNRLEYVVLREDDYATLLGDLDEARLAASQADWQAGRVKRGTTADLLAELADDGNEA